MTSLEEKESVKLDEISTKYFKQKLFVVPIVLVLFLVGLFLLDKVSFKLDVLLNVIALDISLAKLTSLSFIFFVITFSIALAVSVYFGFYLKLLHSLAIPAATLIPAGIIAIVAPDYAFSSVTIAIALSLASISASFHKALSFSTVYSTVKIAMAAFVIIGTLLFFVEVEVNKERYFNVAINSLLILSGETSRQVLLAEADFIENYNSSGIIGQFKSAIAQEVRTIAEAEVQGEKMLQYKPLVESIQQVKDLKQNFSMLLTVMFFLVIWTVRFIPELIAAGAAFAILHVG